MRRTILAAVAACGMVLAGAAPAWAASPHYVQGPATTVAGDTLTVSWKAAGLGNTAESADFALTGTTSVTSQCFTKQGNPVNSVPKRETNNVSVTGSFPVRNGSVTGSLSTTAASTLTCTGNQTARIIARSFDLVLSGDGLPDTPIVG